MISVLLWSIKKFLIIDSLVFIGLTNQYMREMLTQFVFQLVNSFQIYIPMERLWVWGGDGNQKGRAIQYQAVHQNSVHASFRLLISTDIRYILVYKMCSSLGM